MVVSSIGTGYPSFIPTNSPVPMISSFLSPVYDGLKLLIPLLAADADPSAAAMLNDMRLNVLKRYPRENEKDLPGGGGVIFELVPGEQPDVMIDRIKDTRFKLPRAEITSHYRYEEGMASIKIFYEIWRNDAFVRERELKHTGTVYLKLKV
ncbi:hypothetical protein BGZ63DRAFT_404129 [Mariannaea sp. PMI_226]|nr:hypothetical protein BGZ63DRAFT_404129 [Mariannaea sp. PMI_226]